MKRIVAVMALAAMIGLAGHAAAMQVDVPLPSLVAQSELIVIVKVIKTDEPAEMEAVVPAMDFGGGVREAEKKSGHFRKSSVEVVKIHRDTSGKVAAGQKLEVITFAQPPRQADAPLLFVADGPMEIDLKAGQSYMLMLRRRPDVDGYYLSNYGKCYSPAEGIERRLPGFEMYVDIEKWGWGKADKTGLQIAVIVNEPTWAMMATDTRTRERRTNVQYMVALRNTGKETVSVPVTPSAKPLGLTIRTAAGKEVTDLPPLYVPMRQVKPPAKPPIAIAPGQIVFVTAYGQGAYWNYLSTKLAAGTYTLTASYQWTGKPKPEAANAKPDEQAAETWSGHIESAPTQVDVKIHPSQAKNQPPA